MRMGVHLSIKAKLVMASSAAQELKSTMEEFNRACNTLSELAFQRDLHRKYDIHHEGYRLIRQETNLPAQHVINAIAKVSAVYTRAQNKWHQFKSHSSVRYDAKSMTLSPDSQTASLTVCPKGRVTGRLQSPRGMTLWRRAVTSANIRGRKSTGPERFVLLKRSVKYET
jgi:putative transposase